MSLTSNATLIAAERIAIAASIIIAVATLVHGTGEFRFNGVTAWVLASYAMFFGLFAFPGFPGKKSRERLMANCITALLLLLFTCYLYADMWFEFSYDSAFIFIFAPIFLFVGGLVVYGVNYVLLKVLHNDI
jgi:hypothetical protein